MKHTHFNGGFRLTISSAARSRSTCRFWPPLTVVLDLQALRRLADPSFNKAPLDWQDEIFTNSGSPLNDLKEINMNPIEALHDVHTATNDVLTGYREMAARSEPEIQSVIHRLTEMHQHHAAAQEAELARMREAGTDDTSWQGTVNKVVVMMRDWVSDLDRDALPAVRQGEEALLGRYTKALEDSDVRGNAQVVALLQTQYDDVAAEIARLTKS